MRPYWLIWTYIANYSEKPFRVTAANPEAAAEVLYGAFSNEFRAKAKVYVFESEPVLTMVRGSGL